MPSWALRPVLPSGATFKGQLGYALTAIEIPNTLKLYVENLSVEYSDLYINKYTGFETKKQKIADTDGTGLLATVQIMLVGDLPRWLQLLFLNLARGCNGGGMQLDFYDDWATSMQYTGRWYNASDFVDNSTLLCGGSVELSVFTIQAI